MNNTFQVEVLADGRIKITSPGGFSPEIHASADEFLAMIQELAGGPVETKKLQPSLGNPHAQGHSHGQGHHHQH